MELMSWREVTASVQGPGWRLQGDKQGWRAVEAGHLRQEVGELLGGGYI